jgi:predicted MFS family arabinose efflux permease
MSPGRTLLFAVAGGAAVGNLYWSQPILGYIAESMNISTGTARLLVTVTQIGYAVGVFLLVPLGDSVNRKRLIPAMMLLSALSLAASAVAPTFATLLAAMALIGITTVGAQLLAPMAGDLATDEQRGRIVGTVASGLIAGLLVSRTISGVVADAFGWRAIYAVACALIVVLAAVLARALPVMDSRPPVPYGRLLRSVVTTVRHHRTVHVAMMFGASAMAVFTMFWTALTFLLSAAPFHYSATQIGLVGLAGLLGALAALRVGRLYDRGFAVPATGVALLLVQAALVLSALGSRSIVLIACSVALLSLAVQAVNVLGQTRVLSVDPGARSRLNTAFVVGNFIGGTIGSALASTLWHLGGWTAVMVGGMAMTGVALLVWLVQRTRSMTSSPRQQMVYGVSPESADQ